MTQTVQFVEFTKQWEELVWKECSSDTELQHVFPTRQSLRWHVQQQDMAESFGTGLICGIVQGEEKIGFTLFNVIPEEYIDTPEKVVECGTFLFSQYRGQGKNHIIKPAQIHFVEKHWGALYCIFVVPQRNICAQRSLHRLGRQLSFPYQCYTESDVSPFRRFLRRRTWETGVPSIVYVVQTRNQNPV